jgi:hypothetical protein
MKKRLQKKHPLRKQEQEEKYNIKANQDEIRKRTIRTGKATITRN